MDCLVCRHPARAPLLAALPHTPLRTLEAQYGISRSVLQRHRSRGCPAGPQRAETDARVEEPAAPMPPRNPLAAFHVEAVRLHEAALQATHGQHCAYHVIALAALLVRMTTPGAGR